MKDWVIIVGFLLILLILADGIRRKRNERNGNLKVSRSLKKSLKQPTEEEEESPAAAPSYTSELPNGGARIVGQRDPSVRIPSIEKKPQAKSYLEKHQQPESVVSPANLRAERESQQTNLNLGQSVPMLMESIDDAESRATESRIEPRFPAAGTTDADDDRLDDDYEGEDFERDDHPYTRELEDDEERDLIADEREEERQALQDADDVFDEDEYDREKEVGEYEADENEGAGTVSGMHNNLAEKQPAEPEEVLIINVMAHKGEMFNGADLLDIVLQCGMRFGSMDIFHRHSDTKGEGALLFSMANMVKPGTFDLDTMDEFKTPGVSLFMTLPIKADSMQSFDLMADTARTIADSLDGELKDEQRSVMTRQTLDHCRERIRNFERMRLFRRPPPR